MLGYLHPDNIYDDFKKNKLTKQEAIDLLFSLRKKSSSSYFQVRSLEILDEFEVDLPKIVKYASILVNDKFPEVRSRALKLILKNSQETALILLKSIIAKENSLFVLVSIYKNLNSRKEEQFKRLKHEIVKRIACFHGVVFEEGKFILDLYMALNDRSIDLFLNENYRHCYISNRLSDLFPTSVNKEWYPPFIIKNSHIISLDCSLMGLTELPESIGSLSRLRYLNLSDNHLRDLPETISTLYWLKYLDLRGNNLSDIPETFSKLCWLKYLDLSSNIFFTLPKVLNNIKYIKRFHFERNYKLKYIPKWIINFSERIFAKKYIKEGVNSKEAPILGLFEILLGCKFKRIDLEEFGFEVGWYYKINKNGNLIGIYIFGDLENPVIHLIPEQIRELNFLEEFYLSSNRIREIPESLGNLNLLISLDLSFNRISDMENLKFMKNLKKLDLRGNQIKEIKGLENLSELNYLNLDYNPIPEELIIKLGGLKTIKGHKIIRYPQKLIEYCRKLI